MLKGPLAGEDHGGPGLIAGLDHFVIPQGTAGLNYAGDPLAQAHIHAVPEGEEGVGNHHGAGQSGLVLLGSPVDGFFVSGLPQALRNASSNSL